MCFKTIYIFYRLLVEVRIIKMYQILSSRKNNSCLPTAQKCIKIVPVVKTHYILIGKCYILYLMVI